MGINGAITQISPIVGVVIAGSLSSLPVAMFLVPGAIAVVGGLIFVIVMQDENVTTPRKGFSSRKTLQGFWSNPSTYPNLAWVWLSKAF